MPGLAVLAEPTKERSITNTTQADRSSGHIEIFEAAERPAACPCPLHAPPPAHRKQDSLECACQADAFGGQDYSGERNRRGGL